MFDDWIRDCCLCWLIGYKKRWEGWRDGSAVKRIVTLAEDRS